MGRKTGQTKSLEELKSGGSGHYKTGGVEPIDLYLAGGLLREHCISAIIKYAFRNRPDAREAISADDMNKIIHYAEMLKVEYGDEKGKANRQQGGQQGRQRKGQQAGKAAAKAGSKDRPKAGDSTTGKRSGKQVIKG